MIAARLGGCDGQPRGSALNTTRRNSPDEFRDWTTVFDEMGRAAGEVLNRHPRRIDAEVVVDRRQEVMGRATAIDHGLGTAVCGPDNLAGPNPAAKPDIREGGRPMVAAGPLAFPAPVLAA